jgi:hypothetical protein
MPAGVAAVVVPGRKPFLKAVRKGQRRGLREKLGDEGIGKPRKSVQVRRKKWKVRRNLPHETVYE